MPIYVEKLWADFVFCRIQTVEGQLSVLVYCEGRAV